MILKFSFQRKEGSDEHVQNPQIGLCHLFLSDHDFLDRRIDMEIIFNIPSEKSFWSSWNWYELLVKLQVEMQPARKKWADLILT